MNPKTASPTATAPSTERSPEPISDHERIARLAYAYWEARGRQGGSPEEDWFRAEQALQLEKLAKTVAREPSPSSATTKAKTA